MKNKLRDIVGLIPMAGKASRLGKLPFSKELFPIEFKKQEHPQPVSLCLIDGMRMAGIQDIHLVLRNGKWDIPAYFGSGAEVGVNLCYHIAEYGYGVPFTVNQAYPFLKNKKVVFGFPDIVFKPKEIFNVLLDKLDQDETSVVLGSVPVKNTEKWDMIIPGKSGIVNQIIIKPQNEVKLKYNWFIAAWKPVFTDFLKNFVENKLHKESEHFLMNNEYHFGDVLNEALGEKITIKYTVIPEAKCIDLGTGEGINNYKQTLN